MHATYCYIARFIAASLLTTSPAFGAERCNPPSKTCGEDGLNFPCPPCPPRGVHIGSIIAVEQYRESLEKYRQGLEADRAKDPAGTLGDYRKAVSEYKEGINQYKEAVAKAGPEE
jgi:hypothetical protein